MVWGTLLAAIVVGNPPTYVVYHGPEYCCLPAWQAPMIVYEVPCSVQTIPSPAMALVPVPVDPPTTTAAVVQDKTQAKPTDEPLTDAIKATEEDDSVLEDAAFGPPGFMSQRSLDHLSLGWGVSTIGNGTLYPTPMNAGYSGGFGGFGGGSGNNSQPLGGTNTGANWNMINNVLPPITINCPCAPPTTTTNPPSNPNEVPEPTSLAVWSLVGVGILIRRRRGN